MSKRALWTIVGIVLFSIGTLAILVELVGVHFAFLNFLNAFGRLGAFTAKILMIVLGLVVAILANSADTPDDELSDEEK